MAKKIVTDQTAIREIPLNGKLITALDPAIVGTNFQTLKNLRYTEANVKAVDGMTKINSSVMDATYLKTRNGFHFVKEQPAESHVMVQAENAGETASAVLQNETAIPGTGNFTATDVHTDDSSAGLGRFSNAPRGSMAYCNGEESMVWSGDEGEIASFITSTAAITDTITNP